MPRLNRRFTIMLLGLALLWPAQAHAACSDPAAPRVDWQRCYFDNADLKEIVLAGARLRDATFLRSTLDGADFSGADAYHAKFISASMVDVTLTGAELGRADFTKADLTNANLTGTDLRGAVLVNASLKGANLTGADLGGALMRGADFSGATWTDGLRICKTPSIGRCN